MWPEMRLMCNHGGYKWTGILLSGFMSNILAYDLKFQNVSPETGKCFREFFNLKENAGKLP
jgi:hypothetical protein